MSEAANDRAWFTRTESADLCGLSARQFDDVIRSRLKAASVTGAGRTLRFHGQAVVAALVSYRLEQRADPVSPAEGDPMLAGPESPALERYREVRTKLAERDLAERDRELVKGRLIRDALRPAVAALRGTGDRLSRQFGNEAGDVFNEGVADFEAAALRVIEQQDVGPSNSDGRSDADPGLVRGDADAATADNL